MRFGAWLGAALVAVGCLGEDPVAVDAGATNDGGTTSDGGSTLDGGSDASSSDAASSENLPLIDVQDVSSVESSGDVVACKSSADTVLQTDGNPEQRMGGGYVRGLASNEAARSASRPGAVLFTHCAPTDLDKAYVLAAAYGLTGALVPDKDSARLLELVQKGYSEREGSEPVTSARALRIADGAGQPKGRLTLETCQGMAKNVITKTFAGTPRKWDAKGKDFYWIGGRPGTTASIACLVGKELPPGSQPSKGAIVVHVVTIDDTVQAASVVDELRSALNAEGAIE